MKSRLTNKTLRAENVRATSGMTLIEVLLYSTLLSFLIAGFIRYAYDIHTQNIQLLDSINDEQSL